MKDFLDALKKVFIFFSNQNLLFYRSTDQFPMTIWKNTRSGAKNSALSKCESTFSLSQFTNITYLLLRVHIVAFELSSFPFYISLFSYTTDH